MTLEQLHRIAHVSRLGDADTLGLRDSVLAYVAEIRKAESGASPRQRDVLEFWEKYRSEHKMYPTLQEAADELGVKKVCIFEHAEELVRKGLMRRSGKYLSRCLELVR